MPQRAGQDGVEMNSDFMIDDKLEATIRFGDRYINIKVPTMSQMRVMTRYLVSPDVCEGFRGLEVIRPMHTVLDIGANIGLLSILFAIAWPRASIYAIEPSLTNCEYLKHNCKGFPNITIIKKGAYSRAGHACLAVPDMTQRNIPQWNMNTGQLSLYGKGANKEAVELARIDDLFETADFIKIDVEGAELDVLLGGERLLTEHRPILLLELRDENLSMAGHSTLEILKHLEGLGYTPVGAFEEDILFAHKEKRC